MTDLQNNLKLPALVLAGSPADPELQSRYGVEWRAAAPIAGRMMAQYVVDALRNSSRVTDIHMVGNLDCEGLKSRIPTTGSLIENLVAGMKLCGCGDSPALVVTSDIPLLTPEAVDDFVARCEECDADFYYSIVAKEDNERMFPGVRRTYARVKEGTFTGGNVVMMRAGFVLENAGLIRDAFAARKSIPRLARTIGLGVLLRAVVAQLAWPGAVDLHTLEKTVGRILKAKVRAVRTPYAEVGADADDVQQIEAMERLMAGELK